MDPIDPIPSLPPNLPPVAPATGLTRVDRDGGRDRNGGSGPRRREPRRPVRTSPEPVDVSSDDQDTGPHIDITA